MQNPIRMRLAFRDSANLFSRRQKDGRDVEAG
jgi:hypothetical protein